MPAQCPGCVKKVKYFSSYTVQYLLKQLSKRLQIYIELVHEEKKPKGIYETTKPFSYDICNMSFAINQYSVTHN